MNITRRSITVLGALMLVGIACVVVTSIAVGRTDVGGAGGAPADVFSGGQVVWGSDAGGGRGIPTGETTPTISGVAPSVKAVGSAAFQMVISGGSIVTTTTASWNGSALAIVGTPSVSAVTVSVPALRVAVAGSATIKLATGSKESTGTAAFSITQPTLAGVSPTTAAYGALLPVELTLAGTHLKDGLDAPTLVLKGTGSISATTILTTGLVTQTSEASMKGTFSLASAPAGVYDVKLTYGAAGSVTLPAAFTVGPTLTSITPSSGLNSNAAVNFSLVGQRLNGLVSAGLSLRQGTTTFRTATGLTLLLGSTTNMSGTFNLATPTPVPAGVYDVVLTFGTAGSTKLIGGFTVTNPAPIITAPLNPATVYAGSAQPLVLTINGSGFVPQPSPTLPGLSGSLVKLGTRVAFDTTFVSATRLTVPLTAADFATVGAVPITVVNPAPGGGTSNAVNLVVAADTTAPVTTITGADSAWHNTPVVLSVTATDTQSGVRQTQYDINAAAPTDLVGGTITVPADGTMEGQNTVEALSTDWCGNVEDPGAVVTVKIDTVGPKTSGTAPSPVGTGRDAKATFKYRADDLTPRCDFTLKIKYKSSGKVARTYKIENKSTGKALKYSVKPNLAAGKYVFYVYATDQAGNKQSVLGTDAFKVQ